MTEDGGGSSEGRTKEQRLSVAGRAGLAVALLGIACGAPLAMMRTGLDFDWNVPAYASWMLPSIVMGSVAVVLAVIDIVQRDAGYRRPLMVFMLGLAAIATPFFFTMVMVACIIAVAISIVLTVAS